MGPIGKAHGWGTCQKNSRVGLGFHQGE